MLSVQVEQSLKNNASQAILPHPGIPITMNEMNLLLSMDLNCNIKEKPTQINEPHYFPK